ncbi:uncharacterized protein LOC144106537 [Amblyomma americanum]
MRELVQRHPTIPDTNNEKCGFVDTGGQGNTLPMLVTIVAPRSDYHTQDVDARLHCPCSLPSTADAMTQPEQAPMDSRLTDSCPGGGTLPERLRETNERIALETRCG